MGWPAVGGDSCLVLRAKLYEWSLLALAEPRCVGRVFRSVWWSLEGRTELEKKPCFPRCAYSIINPGTRRSLAAHETDIRVDTWVTWVEGRKKT